VSKSHGIKDLTAFAVDTIRMTGEAALSYYGKGGDQVKFDMALVTETELHITELFQTQLHEHFPEHQLFENNIVATDYTHDEKRYLWIFDALDGVANFQAGIPIWGISLALLENFWPILGAFYMPATGDLFWARAGHQAFWQDKPIQVSQQGQISDESLLLTFSRFHQRYQSSFPGKIRNFGCTGAHLSYVAMGRAEAAIVSNITYKDLAASRVVIESAGGKIYKLDGSEFFLNEYLDGQDIAEDLLITSPGALGQVRTFIRHTR
jgi:myo-inositol-1(or 4)-monophosphatase